MQIRFLRFILFVGIFLGMLGCAQESGNSTPGDDSSNKPAPVTEQDNSLKPPTVENPDNQLLGTWINDSGAKFAKYKVSIGPKYSSFATLCLYENGTKELEAAVKTSTQLGGGQLDVTRSASRVQYKDNVTCITQVNVNSYTYRVQGSHLELQAVFQDNADVFSSKNYRKILNY